VKTLVKKPGISMKISVDGGEYEDKKLLLTTFANGEFCGGGFHSNPRAKLNDGEIDSIFVNDITRLKFISLVSYYKNGTHLDSDKFKAIVTPNKFSTVHMIFDNETNVSVDGELISTKELHLSVDKNALGFILPRGANKQGLVELEEKQAASV
jgi:diacylglycerol kinase family enzyme